jgi:hypothetical protein
MMRSFATLNQPGPVRHPWRSLLFILLVLLQASPGICGASVNYTITPDTLDAGGLLGTSALYTIDFSTTAGGAGSSAIYTSRSGYVGQLSAPSELVLPPSFTTIDEGGSLQLSAMLVYDDLRTSQLDPGSIIWGEQSGPLSSISAGGLLTADMVYQDSPAVVNGSYLNFTDSLNLTVLDTRTDNFGSYASDGIDDDWQVHYFGLPLTTATNPNGGQPSSSDAGPPADPDFDGQNNPFGFTAAAASPDGGQPSGSDAGPLADPDFDGQNNLFEFTAGVVPTDPQSVFRLNLESVKGQPGRKQLVFSPRWTDRNYRILSSSTMQADSWTPVTADSVRDVGSQRIITDAGGTEPQMFYRVEITKP